MYKDMYELIRKNNGSRDFFLSQPIYIQLALKEISGYIHTTEQLHLGAEYLLNNKTKGFYRKENK